jgi:hypothetical protein
MNKGDDEIKVVDRRRFDEAGEEREGAGEKADEGGGEVARQKSPVADTADLPPIDFITFVLSLSQTAFLNLGLGLHPETGKAPPVDLTSARWTIESLEMLHEKTRGNLTGEEERIFERILAELRMAYVQIASREGGSVRS